MNNNGHTHDEMGDIDCGAGAAGDGWKTARVRCRLCGHEQVSVYPADVLDEDCLQCSDCEHMTCGPIDDDEEVAP